MRFAQYNYQEFHNGNKELWPIKDWWEMVKINEETCKNIPLSKHLEFRGKCRAIELPSFHPYWRVQILMDEAKHAIKLRQQYDECVADPNKIPILFNKNTQLDDIARMINEKSEAYNILKENKLID